MAQSPVDKNDNSTFSKLIPFITTVLLYFSLIHHTERSSTPSTVLKCMPIVSLLFFVMLTTSKNATTQQYQKRIMYGLLFSSLGDFLLNYDLFEAGMGAFGVAQVFYISAFGMKPLKLWIGVILYLLGFLIAPQTWFVYISFGACLTFVLKIILRERKYNWMKWKYSAEMEIHIKSDEIYRCLLWLVGWFAFCNLFAATSVFFANLNSLIKVCLPFYAILLLTMCWRSLARIEDSHNYPRLVCGIASILFVISDGIIAFDKFCIPIQAAQTFIMVTYYLAQVGITLSVNDVKLNEPTSFIKLTERRNKSIGSKSY